MPKEKSISRVLIWQTAGRFALQGISFFTVPLFTRLLSTSDYGIIAVFASWASLLSLITGLQTHGSIANAKMKFQDSQIDAYLSAVLAVSLLSFAALLIFFICSGNFLPHLFDLDYSLCSDIVKL